jgi:protein-S-isoprenylcysteine O-methyltransferase Ste14
MLYASTLYRCCCFAWFAFAAIWLITAFQTKRTVRKRPFGRQLPIRIAIWLGYVLLFTGLFGGPLNDRILRLRIAVEQAGLAVTLAGLAFACWARFHLGSNWSGTPAVKEHHELIRSGPYRIVRHPIYTGIIAGVLGTALVLGEIRGLISLVLVAIGFLATSRAEEQLMSEQFPDAYPIYKKKVKALIPYVW